MNVEKYFSEDAIRNLMNDGATTDEIVQAFTNKLNAVVADRKKNSQKIKDTEFVVKYFETYYPEVFEGLTVEIFLKALDDIAGALKGVNDVIGDLFKPTKDEKKTEPKSLDDLLKIFGK